MSIAAIIGNGGIGDIILSYQCGSVLESSGKFKDIFYFHPVRSEIYRVVKRLFNKKSLEINPKYGKLEFDAEIKEEFFKQFFIKPEDSQVYFVEPDLLFRNPLAFDYKSYNTTPERIRQIRLLESRWKPEKIIYVGLVTSTDGYLYHNIPDLIVSLAEKLPDHIIYFPLVDKWDNKQLNLGDFNKQFPKNVLIHNNPDFLESIKWMERSCYGIYTDNGSSHLAYQLGQPRLLLDPRFPVSKLTSPWVARWRTTTEESIPIQIEPDDASEIVKTHLTVPQTRLIPAMNVLMNLGANWSNDLIFKF